MIPDMIIPPMAPSRITSIGTSTPRPRSNGLRNVSLTLTNRPYTRKITAAVVLWVANAHTITGPTTKKGGNCITARIMTSSAQTMAPGTPMKRNPIAASAAWITAIPRTPWKTLRMVITVRRTSFSPGGPARRLANLTENACPCSPV